MLSFTFDSIAQNYYLRMFMLPVYIIGGSLLWILQQMSGSCHIITMSGAFKNKALFECLS